MPLEELAADLLPGPAGRPRVKICGCRTAAEVAWAAEVGADAVGLILAPSPRRVSLERAAAAATAAPAGLALVGVFVNPERAEVEMALARIPRLRLQFSGEEGSDFCGGFGRPYIKAVAVAEDGTGDPARRASRHPGALILLDTRSGRHGGSGRTFDWAGVSALARARPVVVSGGLRPDNVARCLELLHPYGVDVRSGVEGAAGQDPGLVRDFVAVVRGADGAA
ncbi:MAG: phosphoribosylanthranilate isomerase [Candidatus Dormibacteria bacterium]